MRQRAVTDKLAKRLPSAPSQMLSLLSAALEIFQIPSCAAKSLEELCGGPVLLVRVLSKSRENPDVEHVTYLSRRFPKGLQALAGGAGVAHLPSLGARR
jgi:hypothetical protein